MRYWTVASKYLVYRDGELSHTEVTISASNEGYANITVQVAGDQLGKSDAELIELAREAFFKTEFAARAMAESVQKIDGLETSLKKGQEMINAVQEQMGFVGTKIAQLDGSLEEADSVIKQMKEQLELADSSRLGFTSLVLLLYGKGVLTDEDLTEAGLFEL